VYLVKKLPALPAGCHHQWHHITYIKQVFIYLMPDLPPFLLKIEIIKNKNNKKFYQNQRQCWQWWQRWQLPELCFV
jgi:hypothetical protein